MRQVEVQVPEGRVEPVRRLADEQHAFAPHSWRSRRGDEAGWVQVTVQLPNDRVGRFVRGVAAAVPEAGFVLRPRGTLPLRPPLGDLRDQVADVSPRSTLELVLSSLQSIGSWRGMTQYAVISGLVAAYAVIFDIPYLLTAAMLIAPMGAPVMVAAVGVTLGDARMVRRGSLRFLVAIALAAATAAILGAAYGLDVSTRTMEGIANLSAWAVLLAVAGGAAGAQALVRSDRDSLVTATATGFLVAVSLSPPAAVLGLAAAMGRGDYVALMTFTLLLNFFGTVIGGWVSLRYFGVDPEDASDQRSSPQLQIALVAGGLLVLLALVAWQTTREPRFQKADLTKAAVRATREAVAGVGGSRLVQGDASFTRERAGWHVGEGVLVRVVVKRTGAANDIEAQVRDAVERRIRERLPGVEPFVDVVVIP